MDLQKGFLKKSMVATAATVGALPIQRNMQKSE